MEPPEDRASKLRRAAALAELFISGGQEARQAIARAAQIYGVEGRLVLAAVEELRSGA